MVVAGEGGSRNRPRIGGSALPARRRRLDLTLEALGVEGCEAGERCDQM